MKKEVKSGELNESRWALASGILSALGGISSLLLIMGNIFSFLGLFLLSSFGLLSPVIFGVFGILFARAQARNGKTSSSRWGYWLSIVGIVFAIAFLIILIISVVQGLKFYNACSANPSLPECAQIAPLLQLQNAPQ